MESEFDKWQALWQQQKANPINIEKLSQQLNKVERRTKYQRIFFFFASVFASYNMLSHLSFTIYNIAAITLIGIAMLAILIPLYKNRLKPDNIDNQQYISNKVEYLNRKLLIPKRYFLIFIILFVLALNIAFLGTFESETLIFKTLAHSLTGVILIALLLLRKVGIKNYERAILPLVNQFEKLEKQT